MEHAHEITELVDLCSGGLLNRHAVGWTRSALHRTNLTSSRAKRWEYWGIITDDHAIGLTIADLGYAHLEQIYVARLADGKEWIGDSTSMGSLKPGLSDDPPPFTSTASRLSFAIEPEGHALLSVTGKDIAAELVVEPGGEALGVVIPWSDKKFQYTLKDLARPVRGTLTLDGETIDLDGWAVLDRGRGIWPYSMTWNWGAGSGIVDGSWLGLQVGGKWTDGTGLTENALFVEGIAHYIPDELDWTYDLSDPTSPWRVHGPRIDATLTPQHRRKAATNVGIISSRTFQAFGTWSGWARDSDGVRHRLDGLTGWAEEARNRW